MASADHVILPAALVTIGSTTASHVLPASVGGKGELPDPKLLIGGILTFAGLSILGDFAPSLAGPFSVAIAVTALTYYGLPLADNWFNGAHNIVGLPDSNTKPKGK